ncbi:sensor histidine kinase [Dyadobacter sp. CY312]|uniref:sensor histidine kinase n=1 Tax=Dyadobacter sp. CY312 TaxID=2907303 RepID=UPI001F26DAAF|nr:histidine kinase [Dyadobacter sp. CY312]MCE7044277.1 histidine kinase [Dyadobacter sp. CY312]
MFRQKNPWMLHVIGWFLFIILPLTIISREPDADLIALLLRSGWFWTFFLIYLIVFYGNIFVLIPKLFFRGKYIAYISLFLSGILFVFYFQPFENLIFKRFHQSTFENFKNDGEQRPKPPPPFESAPGELRKRPPRAERPERDDSPAVDFVSLILFIFVWAVAMATKISEQWRLSEKRVILSEADKAQAELAFFKAQINPHFLFNTLNNLYSLAITKSDHTAPGILKLSQLMRYITEEATADFVALEDEIKCLENYIDLQKLRLNAKTTVSFLVEGKITNQRIAPLVFMTFVENAFKYGISSRFDNLIEIKVRVGESQIFFSSKNQIFDRNQEAEREGIGIANTRKRLNFLYHDRYDLKITDKENRFEVGLNLRSDVVTDKS